MSSLHQKPKLGLTFFFSTQFTLHPFAIVKKIQFFPLFFLPHFKHFVCLTISPGSYFFQHPQKKILTFAWPFLILPVEQSSAPPQPIVGGLYSPFPCVILRNDLIGRCFQPSYLLPRCRWRLHFWRETKIFRIVFPETSSSTFSPPTKKNSY